jgi:cytochrome c-type biogenesis protein CcmF
LLAVLATIFRFWPGRQPDALREPAFALLMAYLCFLLAVMVFGADPLQASLSPLGSGSGLSPALQHPAMLVHPPIVFLGYAAWGVPCALALAALMGGPGIAGGRKGTGTFFGPGTVPIFVRRKWDCPPQPEGRKMSQSPTAWAGQAFCLDAAWVRAARPWALFAWATLGSGILIGAVWAYEELGWGGYWSWDPVENGSFLPWLTGTAFIHCLMAWQYLGILKKTAAALAVATFGLCNFATFLTRSGIFSSLHEFSRSPIGWLFLALMAVLVVGGTVVILARRAALAPQRPISSFWSREAMVLIGTLALVLLAMATLAGTLAAPLSQVLTGRAMVVGPAFYNSVLIPTGGGLLASMAVGQLVRWGHGPTAGQKKMLLLRAMIGRRRPSAGFLAHLGVACLAIGVCGSALGSRRHDLVMNKGESVAWAGRSIRYADLIERGQPERSIVEARLEVSEGNCPPYTLLPAQHLIRSQNAWVAQVAIHSTWSGDFYTILHGGKNHDAVSLTFIDNPAMRWLWLSGWLAVAGAVVGLWPARRGTASWGADPVGGRAQNRGPHRFAAARHPHSPGRW